MNRRFLMPLAVGLTVAVAGAHQDADDKKNLQGVWKAVAFEESGKQAMPRLLESISWEFKGDDFIWRMEGHIELQGNYTIDQRKKPKEIDLFEPKSKVKFVGIYDIENGQLKLRFHSDKEARPGTFTTAKETRDHFLLVLKRPKD